MEKAEKFSNCVKELTTTWIKWLKNNSVATDGSIPHSVRREAAEMCEVLIKRRHSLINTMNSYFEE